MDTVEHLQLEVEALKFVQSGPSMLDMKTLPVQYEPVAFTSTKVDATFPYMLPVMVSGEGGC